MKKIMTYEEKLKNAERMREYRKKHPEYMKKYHESLTPEQKRIWAQRSWENKKKKIIQDYLREGMIIEGWKIEITHVYKGKIQQNRKMITEEMMFDSHNQVLKFTFERMLEEFGL